jgi:hypothetical protein
MSSFFSAWVPPSTPWSNALKIKDLDIATLNVTQSENNCATLTVLVRNPQVGLLAVGRLVWLWLAWENDLGVTTPIFYGRLIPVPNRATNEGQGATLSFLARPLNFDTQRVAAALALQTAPFYDPIFIDPTKRLVPVFGDTGTGAPPILGTPRPPESTANPDIVSYSGDPDAVLEGWARLWSIDRVTGEVDSSDILEGEDGVEVFNADEIPEASIQLNTATSVLTDITVVGMVNWTQSDKSSFAIGVSGTAPNGLDIISGWPKAGGTLAGGYEVRSTETIDYQSLGTAQVQQKGWRYENKAKQHKQGDVISISWNYAQFPPGLNGSSYLLSETVQQGTAPQLDTGLGLQNLGGADEPNLPFHFNANILVIADVPFAATMNVGAASKLSRNETLTLKLAADIQPLIVLPTSAQTPSAASPVSISGSDVGVPIDGVAPISSSGSNFFPTSRGQEAINYLMAVGIAHLKSANRAVSITWDTTFERAIALSCRKNATINAHLIPGGTATGKIISYSFTASGPDMQLKGTVTIGCCIGKGATGTVSGVTGTPMIGVPGLFGPGIEINVGGTVVFGANTAGLGDTSFTPPVYAPQPGEPTFPLTRGQCVVSEGFTTEYAFVNVGNSINQYTGDVGPPVSVQVPIAVYNLELLNLTGSFASTYDLTATPVKLPKQIDLTVPSW